MIQPKDEKALPKKSFQEDLQQWANYQSLSSEERKRLSRKGALLMGTSFQKEYGCFQYAVWAAFIGLILDSAYMAMIGEDWIAPIVCLVGLILFALLAFIIVSRG